MKKLKLVFLTLALLLLFINITHSQLWQDVGGGFDKQVGALQEYNGELYASGSFTTAGGLNAQKIAKWDGTSWDSLNVIFGGTGWISVGAFTIYDSSLIISGTFTTVNGDTVNNIVQWNGTNWFNLGGGLTGVINLLVFNNELYAVGWINISGNYVYAAKWDGISWNGVGSEVSDNVVAVIAIYKNEIYVGGYFNEYIKKWNGTNWVSVGGGIGDPSMWCCHVNALSVYNNELYAGGNFTSAGGNSIATLAKWDSSNWSAINITQPVMFMPSTMKVYNNELYIGGGWFQISGITNLAKWDGINWYELAVMNRQVSAIELFNGELYIGGEIFDVDGDTVNHVVKMDTSFTGINNSIFPINQIKIFPNPIQDRLFLKIIDNRTLEIEIYNLFGKLIYKIPQHKISNKLFNVDFSNQPSGIYYIKVITAKGILTNKVVIIR